jgi:hypothetical protein
MSHTLRQDEPSKPGAWKRRKSICIILFCASLGIFQISQYHLSLSVWFHQSTTFQKEVGPANKIQSPLFTFSEEDIKVFEQNDCIVLENICSLQGPSWFYQRQLAKDTFSTTSGTPRQPDFILEPEFNPDLRLPKQVSVNSSNEVLVVDSCQESLVPNHVVVTGAFINMAMEVYVRLVSGLYELWSQISTSSWWKQQPNTPHIQFYVHIQGNTTQLLPTMHPMFKGFTNLPLLNFLSLFQQDGCHCYQRLILCGYFDAVARDRIMRRKRRRKKQQGNQQPKLNNSLSETTKGIKQFRPGLQVGRIKGENVDPPIPWDQIRNHIRYGVFQSYPNLEQRILDFKRNALVRALASVPGMNASRITEESSEERLDEWTLVGFSQRNVRRRWLNLEDILMQCLQEWLLPWKVLCVEIQLDSDVGLVPENQVIMHAKLDALIGVHGSQQVHAVWMPDGAYVLELLPHLLGKWGQWTQSTDSRTPNGKMINHTKLNHVGYPLDGSSVPDCEGALHYLKEQGLGCNNAKRWDERDIWVQPQIVESFVRKFLVLTPNDGSTTPVTHPTVTNSPTRSCQEYDQLAYDEFVLYHVNCVEDGKHLYRNYFRPRESFVHLKLGLST